jgi:cyanophycinase
MCASKVSDGQQRGRIISISGAEEKDNSPAILKRFVELASGSDADIVVIPTASQMRDAEEPSRIARLEQASGVFFTGGNQLRLSTLIGGTPVAKATRMANARGVPVAGSSADAAYISEHMIAFGDEGSTPSAGFVRLTPGLVLTSHFIIDQHFRQRDRLGRRLTALLQAARPNGVLRLPLHSAAGRTKIAQQVRPAAPADRDTRRIGD